MKNIDGNKPSNLGMLASVGMEIAVPVALGALIGSYLDNRFETSPWLIILLTVLGSAAGFYNLARMLKKINK